MQKQFNGGRTNFSTNGVGWISSQKKKKRKKPLNLDFIPYTEINSKWITDLNVQCKAMKLLEKYIRENLQELELGRGLGLDTKSIIQINTPDFTKLKFLLCKRSY